MERPYATSYSRIYQLISSLVSFPSYCELLVKVSLSTETPLFCALFGGGDPPKLTDTKIGFRKLETSLCHVV